MTPAIQGSAAAAATTGQNAASMAAGGAGVDKNMFLQLLVAQLQNQDPLNPSDGTQFVAQLAQFQQLEQSINMGQDITAMRTDLDKIAAGGTAATSQA
jgi:flagellar basal-body rod modification protein FlgD